MALRTRLFGAALRMTEKGIEDVVDFPKRRAKRIKLQCSFGGRRIFGTVDKRATVEEITVGAGSRALIYRPKGAVGPLPCVINYHGGGWVQGNPEQSGWLSSRVAARNKAVVIVPSYRLAPEDVFPAAVEDCWAAVTWIAEHAEELGISAERLAVMGDSAGGNLAAVMALLARDAGGPPLRAQVLIYPGVEIYDKWPSEVNNVHDPVLSSANMRAFGRLYLGDDYGTEDFRASPIRATSHAGLPKAFIITAEHDPLQDNGAHYREALVAAGVPGRYAEYGGAIHGFMSLPGAVPVAKKALDDIVEFLSRTV